MEYLAKTEEVSDAIMMEIERWPWERDLRNGSPMPDFLPLPDQMAYTAMRNILTAVQKGTISKQQATVERAAIRFQYDRLKEQLDFDAKLTAHQVRVTRETEIAASVCRKDPIPENAIRLCNILVGIGLPPELDGNGSVNAVAP